MIRLKMHWQLMNGPDEGSTSICTGKRCRPACPASHPRKSTEAQDKRRRDSA